MKIQLQHSYLYKRVKKQLLNIKSMRKQNLFAEEYVAPELEVISMVVEAGFTASAGFEDSPEDDYGEF